MKGCFVGSGSEGLQQPEVCSTLIDLTGKDPKDVVVLYIGTATYDLTGPKKNQTVRFIEAGCTVVEIKCAHKGDTTSYADMENNCRMADIIIVSGGNTLYAIDKWHSVGLAPLLVSAAKRGAVLSGGSAGAICWFDAGHSDSGDPDTYKDAMMREAAGAVEGTDESSDAPADGANVKSWVYMRVPCLGLFPGLVCPHADKVQSNGVLRATDFDEMMLRHPGERGLCIDHFAALVVEGEDYRVLSLPGRPGSVLPDESFSSSREGVPGMWRKDVVDGCVVTTLVPWTGKLCDLLKPAQSITEDSRLEECRAANPID